MEKKTEAEEKAEELVEYYLGDCACDQFDKCTSCKLKLDISYALLQFKNKGYEQGYKQGLSERE